MADQSAVVEFGENKPIKITAEDLQPKDVFEQNLLIAQSLAKSRLPHAQSLRGFMMLTNATRNLTSNSLGWAREGNEDRTPEEWLADFTDDSRDREHFQREADIANTMLRKVDLAKPTEKVQVVVSKLKNDGPLADYRALAVFPDGARAGYYDVGRVSSSQRDIVYMELYAACNQQAVEQVLGENDTASFEIDNLDVSEVGTRLGFDISLSPQQNFRYRDAEGNMTGHRDEKLYLLNAILGGFSNETSRFLLSDFVQKSSPTSGK